MNLLVFKKRWFWDLILSLSFIFALYFFGNRKLHHLKKHPKITIGYTTGIWKDTKDRPYVEYSYRVNGTNYNSQKGLEEDDRVIIPNGKILVIYDSTRVSISAAIFNIDMESYEIESNLDSIFKDKVKSINMWNWQ